MVWWVNQKIAGLNPHGRRLAALLQVCMQLQTNHINRFHVFSFFFDEQWLAVPHDLNNWA